MQESLSPWIDSDTFHTDVDYLEKLWQPLEAVNLPIIDLGQGQPVVFVPILEHLEFVYARQVRDLSLQRRVILYRRQESRTRIVKISERCEELLRVLEALQLDQCDLIAHGDAAMVLLQFAIRYPQRCRSLSIIAQGADYRISPDPFIWWLHELYLRLPVEYILPAGFLRQTVIKYIVAHTAQNTTAPALPSGFIEEQFRKIVQWPRVYKFSVLPVIHTFDIRQQLQTLTMPILLINREDDVLSPEEKTRWMAKHLPHCAGYHVIAGRERFFMYSQAAQVTPLLIQFLAEMALPSKAAD